MTVEHAALFFVVFHVVAATIAVRGVLRDNALLRRQRVIQGIVAVFFLVVGPVIVIVALTTLHTRKELREILPFPLYFFAYDHERMNERRKSGLSINPHMRDGGD